LLAVSNYGRIHLDTLENMDTRSSHQSRSLRAKLVANGHTYRSFGRKVGVSEHTVKAAVRGQRAGIKAKLVLSAIAKLSHA
jgi:DNA-binding CsgD family transcriptional regulator